MTNEHFTAILAELKRIRAALERPHVQPVYVDYATGAKMLCLSKRSVERLVSQRRIRVYDIAGPKLRVSDVEGLGDTKAAKARAARHRRQSGRDELMERVKAMAAAAEGRTE